MLIPSHIWKQSFFAPFVLIPAIIFLIVAFYLFLRKFFPACLPYVANDRITHVPKKKLRPVSSFFFLTVPAALGAVWCAKHAYRYHLAVHPLPYSPEQGALLEKHRQDKRNARLNPHAPVLFLGSSTMEFWLKEGKHSWETWFSPLGCLNLGTRSETTGNLLWRLNDGLTSPLAPKIIVLYSGVNNPGVQKSLGWTAFQGNVAIVKKNQGDLQPGNDRHHCHSPAHRAKRVAYGNLQELSAATRLWRKCPCPPPSISSFRERMPAFILGTAFISTPWDMKPFRLRFSASSNSF